MRFRAQTIDADIPWLGHERDDVVVFDDGSAFALFELQGVPFEALDDRLITRAVQRSQPKLHLRSALTPARAAA